MPRKRKPLTIDPRKLGLLKYSPERIWEEFTAALARYLCTHAPEPCAACVEQAERLRRPLVQGWFHAALHLSKRKEAYEALGRAAEEFVDHSRSFRYGQSYRIYTNAARCSRCGDTIDCQGSTARRWCSCHAIWIAGGYERLERGGDLQYFQDLSVKEDV